MNDMALIPIEDQLEHHARQIEIVTVGALYQIGKHLHAARDIHSARKGGAGFEAWCVARLGYDKRQANKIIHVYENLPGEVGHWPTLSDKALLKLAAPSTPQEVRDTVTAKASAGEKVTAAEVERLKKQVLDAQEAARRAEKNLLVASEEIEASYADQIKALEKKVADETAARAKAESAAEAAAKAAEIAAEAKYKARAGKMVDAAMLEKERALGDLTRAAERQQTAIENLERRKAEIAKEVEEAARYQAKLNDRIEEERYLIEVMSAAQSDIITVMTAFEARTGDDFSDNLRGKVRAFLKLTDNMRAAVAECGERFLELEAV